MYTTCAAKTPLQFRIGKRASVLVLNDDMTRDDIEPFSDQGFLKVETEFIL